MSIQNCVYCGNEITKRSSEHVIQNALGGRYESTDICCPECNNYISQEIDVPFTTIFNPIVGHIDNLAKNNHKKSTPVYSGIVKYQGQEYIANMKAGKITGCPELSKKLRTDAAKLPLEVVGYNFNLANDYFKNGMCKIAFNYALASGIDFELIKSNLHITKANDKITKIDFTYPIVAFRPLNSIDYFIELETPFELYHNMILFSQSNNLWCYIDLFNTFQYYVLLSQEMPAGTDIHETYMQTLQKPKAPDIKIYDFHDVAAYAKMYGVAPTMDADELKKRIQESINAKSYKQSIDTVIGKKLSPNAILALNLGMFDRPNLAPAFKAIVSYFGNQICNEDDLRFNLFRTVTPTMDHLHTSYPWALNEDVRKNGMDELRKYTTAKFNRLNRFLCAKTK